MKNILKKIYNTVINYNSKKSYIYNKINEEKGYALVIVFTVLVILMILGTAFASIAINEIRQAERHEKRVQAYYYARSGAEKAYNRIKEGLEEDFTFNTDKFGNFTWDLKNNLITEDTNPEDRIIDVKLYDKNNNILNMDNYSSLEEFADENGKIHIKSIGRVKYRESKITETVILDLTVPEIQPYNPPPAGEYDDNPVDARDKDDWTSGNSGNINETGKGNIKGTKDESIVFKAPGNGNSLKYNEKNKFAKYRAKTFYFADEDAKPIQIEKGNLKLFSTKIIFYIKVEFKNNGKLCLHTSQNETDELGLVYFAEGIGSRKSGAYYFKDGTCLPGNEDDLIPYYGDMSDIEEWKKRWK